MRKKESSFVIAEDSHSRILAIWETKKGKQVVGPPCGTVEASDGFQPFIAARREFRQETGGMRVKLDPEPFIVLEEEHVIRYGFEAIRVRGKLPPNAELLNDEEFVQLNEEGQLRPFVLGAIHRYRALRSGLIAPEAAVSSLVTASLVMPDTQMPAFA